MHGAPPELLVQEIRHILVTLLQEQLLQEIRHILVMLQEQLLQELDQVMPCVIYAAST